MTPVLRPPTRAETDTWLRTQISGEQDVVRQAEASSAEAEGSGFVMDPNTGKLVSQLCLQHLAPVLDATFCFMRSNQYSCAQATCMFAMNTCAHGCLCKLRQMFAAL